MRKRVLQLLIVFLMIVPALPIGASACGGFVSVKRERIFHSVYCDDLEGLDLKNLRWFDTAKQAENCGLKMCENCSDCYEWDYSCDYYTPYWGTDDHLLLTALEFELEEGHQLGYDSAAEEFDYYYESGYESGYDDGRNEDDWYGSGYNTGHNKSSEPSNEEAENKKQASDGSWVIYAFAAVVLYLTYKIGMYVGEKSSSKTIGQLHTENLELNRTLTNQKEAMYLLNLIAEKGNFSVEYLVDSIFINFFIGMGHTEEEAKE